MSLMDEMVDDVNWFQQHQPFHPLTCRHCDERNDLLLPIAEKHREEVYEYGTEGPVLILDDVVIVCPTCQGAQALGEALRTLVVGMSRQAQGKT